MRERDSKQKTDTKTKIQRQGINAEHIEDQWKYLRNCIHDIQENIVGMTIVGKLKKKRTGWWTEEVEGEVERKEKCFRQWLKIRTPENRLTYEVQINHVRMKRKAWKEMWERIGKDLQEDIQGTRKLLYSISKTYKNRNSDKPKNSILECDR